VFGKRFTFDVGFDMNIYWISFFNVGDSFSGKAVGATQMILKNSFGVRFQFGFLAF
jgi:hypothetical protein